MERIVVGVDGSQESHAALRWAAAAAQERGMSLHIVCAMYAPAAMVPFETSAAAPLTEDLQKSGEALLGEAAGIARGVAPGTDVQTELVAEPAVLALLDRTTAAHLVVVGSRGLGSVGAAFLGSVSTRLAARSACPTVVVRPDAPGDQNGPIVAGVDGSPQSDAVYRIAISEAAHRGSDVNVICAYQVPPLSAPLQNAAAIDDLVTHQRQATELQLDELTRRHETPSRVDVRTAAVFGAPAPVLASASANASLLVIGSRGRGAVLSMLLGSVSQQVLHQATSPVVVVNDEVAAENDGT